MMVCEISPWLREANSVIDMLSSVLLTVASNDSDDVIVEDSSSGSTTDVTLLGEGSASMTELVSAPESDEVSAADRVSELVTISDRSVGCARMLVGVVKSDSITTELVPVISSTILELTTSSDADDAIETCSETTLDGISVKDGRIETSVAISRVVSGSIEVSVWASPIEMIDGAVVISARLLEETDSVVCVRILVGVTNSDSMGTVLVLALLRSITELLASGKLGTFVCEERSSDTTLERISVAEERVGASVTIWETVVCVSDTGVVNGKRSDVSVRVLIGGTSDSTAELSITTELKEELSWVAELEPRSPSPVSRDSGDTDADVIRSRILLDGKSVITGTNPVTESEDSTVAEGIARTLVVKSDIVSDETEVLDARSELNVMDGSSVVSKVLGFEDSGSRTELSITVEIKDEASWTTETLSTELVAGISDASVTKERMSSLVIDGKSLVESGTDVVSSVGSALVMEGVEMTDKSSELIVVDGKLVVSSRMLENAVSDSLVEVSTTVGIRDGLSGITKLVADNSSAVVTEITLSSPVIDGKLFVRVDVGVVSSVGSALVIRGVELIDKSSELIVIDGSPTVSSRVLDVTESISMIELSTTVGINDEASWATELVTRTSGVVVAEKTTSVLVIDCKSLVGANVDMTSRVPSVLVTEGVGISDGSSKLTVVEGNLVASSTMPVDIGSTATAGMAEMSIAVGIPEEAPSTELMEAISGFNVTEERISSPVIDGKSLVRTGPDVASTVKSVLVVIGESSERSLKLDVTDNSSPSTVLVGRGSWPIAEPSVTDVMIDDVSCAMELASIMLVSEITITGVTELESSTLTLDGISVTEGNIEVVSRVTPMSVVDDTEAWDWISLLVVTSGISVGCSRGSVVTEDSLSSTELLTESWAESVGVTGVKDSVWTADAESSGSESEVKEVMNVVGPPRMSRVEVSMLVRSSETVAVGRTGISLEVTTLL
jgi:hypothetical protein